ncbi:c-type cytochrome [Spirosoma soli]|uniref:C-type cytochrome n=1 Tax=Spirosoma soli TaxID=1770529 RepID=A0ABW5M278_9BACT
MLSPNQFRSLTTALTGLIVLVVLSVVLLFTSAFLYPNDVAEANTGNRSKASLQRASINKSVALNEQQLHGKTLFQNNCAQCHATTGEIVVGPGLAGVTKRAPSEAWLLKWIRNSQAVVASGDSYGVQLYNKFNQIAMSSFTNLTDADIKAILSYVDAASTTESPIVIE